MPLLSARGVELRILESRIIAMSQRKSLQKKLWAGPAETARELRLVGDMDLLRLKSIARLHARGLPADIGWTDLLQEAFARVLDGSRKRPEGLSMLVFLAGIMRSLKSEHWRRAIRQHRYQESEALDLLDPTADPERTMAALQELAAIDRLFADDPVVLQIIAGLGEGYSAEQIRLSIGISITEYDSARKRLRRVLLREGLTCREE
jgi:DNA-directed RNA polymerase specialized sigma24 family protein